MAEPNHQNYDYSGAVPLITGDAYWAQDLGRDFHYLGHQAGLAAMLAGLVPLLVRGGGVKRGTGDTLSLSEQEGYVSFDVTVPDSFAALPPTTKTVTKIARVKAPALTDMAVTGATLDGTTWNYVKLAYAETDGPTRARNRASGTYAYERVPSYAYTVSSAAPTAYQLVVAKFRGEAAGLWTIVPATATIQLVEAGTNLAEGDSVILAGGYRPKARAAVSTVLATSSGLTGYTLGKPIDVAVYEGQMVVIVPLRKTSDGRPYIWILRYENEALTEVVAPTEVDTSACSVLEIAVGWVANGYFIMVWRDSGAGNIVCRGGRLAADGTLSWTAAKTTIEAAATSVTGLQMTRTNEHYVYICWCRNATDVRHVNIKNDGTVSIASIQTVTGGTGPGRAERRGEIAPDGENGGVIACIADSTLTVYRLCPVSVAPGGCLVSTSGVPKIGASHTLPVRLVSADGIVDVLVGAGGSSYSWLRWALSNRSISGLVVGSGICDGTVNAGSTSVRNSEHRMWSWGNSGYVLDIFPSGGSTFAELNLIGIHDCFSCRQQFANILTVAHGVWAANLAFVLQEDSGNVYLSVVQLPLKKLRSFALAAASAGGWVPVAAKAQTNVGDYVPGVFGPSSGGNFPSEERQTFGHDGPFISAGIGRAGM